MAYRFRRRHRRRRVLLALVLLTGVAGGGAALAVVASGWGLSKEQYLARGNAYAGEQKYAEAIIEYRNAVKKDPKDGQARARLADAYMKSGSDARYAPRETILAADLLPDDVDLQIQAGQFLLLSGKYEEARHHAERALAKDPKNVSAHILKGNATAGLKDFDTAIGEIYEAIKTDPHDARSYTSLGAIALTQGRRTEAEAAFKRAVAMRPSLPMVHLALANFYWSTGRIPEVEPLLNRAIELDARSVAAHRALATYYMVTGRVAEVEASLKAVVEILKNLPSRFALADYYIASRRTADAKALLKTLAEDPQGYALATVRLAALGYSEQHVDAAHREVDAVIAKHPKNVEALLLKVRFFMREKKLDEALARAKAAIAAQPRSAAARNALGTIFALRGNVDEAIAAFDEVFEIEPQVHDRQDSAGGAPASQGRTRDRHPTRRRRASHRAEPRGGPFVARTRAPSEGRHRRL